MPLKPNTPVTFADAIHALESTTKGFTFLDARNEATTIPFAELKKLTQQRAGVLRDKGVRAGDRVALVLPDPREFVLSFLAVSYCGAVPVPMYPPLSLGKLEQYLESACKIMGAAGARWLLTSKQVETVLWPALQRVSSLQDIITTEKIAAIEAEPMLSPAVNTLDDLAFLQFTSGSTSDPKGVRVTHRSLFNNCHVLLTKMDASAETDHGVSWLPLYHDMGLIGFVLGPLLFDIPVTFIPTLNFIKRPTIWLDTLAKVRGTITFAPNFAYALLDKRVSDEQVSKWDLSSVRVAGCGAEPIQSETLTRFMDKFARAKFSPLAMMPSYGMAEATLAIAFHDLGKPVRTDVISRDTYEKHKRAEPLAEGAYSEKSAMGVVSCGSTFAGHTLGIMSEQGTLLGERSVGEIVFRGPSVADGYHGRRDATLQSFGDKPGESWLHTGDLGYLADGELFICGRKKDLIIINGRNYYPPALEWAVENVASVRKGNVVCCSVPGDMSEALVVVLEARGGNTDKVALAAEVKRVLLEQFGLSAQEVVVLGPGMLPKTSSGKLQRQKTRSLYLANELERQGVRTLGAQAQKIQLAQHVLRSLRVKLKHRLGQIVGSYLRYPAALPAKLGYRASRPTESVSQNQEH